MRWGWGRERHVAVVGPAGCTELRPCPSSPHPLSALPSLQSLWAAVVVAWPVCCPHVMLPHLSSWCFLLLPLGSIFIWAVAHSSRAQPGEGARLCWMSAVVLGELGGGADDTLRPVFLKGVFSPVRLMWARAASSQLHVCSPALSSSCPLCPRRT